jgi:hypothetical protein
MYKKAQSALEFLMTYGWAILVVLAAIGALAYFGVLNPSNFLPDQCTASTGVGCLGKPQITSTQIVFVVINGLGTSLILDSTATDLPSSCSNIQFANKDGSSPAASKTIADGTEFRVIATCNTTGSFKGTFGFNYTNSVSSLGERIIVQIQGKVR